MGLDLKNLGFWLLQIDESRAKDFRFIELKVKGRAKDFWFIEFKGKGRREKWFFQGRNKEKEKFGRRRRKMKNLAMTR